MVGACHHKSVSVPPPPPRRYVPPTPAVRGDVPVKLPPLTDQLLALGDRLLGQPGGVVDVAVDLRDPAALYFGELLVEGFDQ